MYYLINDDESLKYHDISNVIDYCVSVDYYMEDTDGFEEYLNQDGPVEIYGYEFQPSDVLKQMDEDYYESALKDWAENQMENNTDDYEYELSHANPGDCVYICGYDVYVYDEDEDDEVDDTSNNLNALEERIVSKKQQETENEKKIEDSFFSALGIQVI